MSPKIVHSWGFPLDSRGITLAQRYNLFRPQASNIYTNYHAQNIE